MNIPPTDVCAAGLFWFVRFKAAATAVASTGEPSENMRSEAKVTVHEPSEFFTGMALANWVTSTPALLMVKSFSPIPWLTNAQPVLPLDSTPAGSSPDVRNAWTQKQNDQLKSD